MNNAKYRTPIQNDRCEQRKRKKIPDNIDQNEWNEEKKKHNQQIVHTTLTHKAAYL